MSLRQSLSLILLPVAFLTTALPVWAHHNSSNIFDFASTTRIEGTLVRVEWTNPHVYLYLQQRREDGGMDTWAVQAGGVGSMSRMGWSRDKFAIGTRFEFTGHPGQRGAPEMLLLSASLGQATRPTRVSSVDDQIVPDARAQGLGGTWWTLLDGPQSGLAFFPDDNKLTDKGVTARGTFDDTSEFPGLDCVPFIAPFSMLLADLKHVRVTPDRLIITSEYDAEERTIWLEEAPATETPSLHGHSVGRWLDEHTLEVRTDTYAQHRVGNGWALPSGSQRSLLERFALAKDGSRLTYSYTLSDPEFLQTDLDGTFVWTPRPDLALMTTGCDLASAKRYLRSAAVD
ncbi:MAG: DUF6152 family protein [Pseudomonadota bacterium]